MEQQPGIMDRCIGERQLAELTNLTAQTLRRWRCEGKGPRFLRLGGAVKYRMSDVESWLAANTQ
jgi:predicted DNA-binding transcriptional regulator AlpA